MIWKKTGIIDEYCINGGVLLMNLDEMQKGNFTEIAKEFAEKYHDKMKLVDQTIINGRFHNQTALLPIVIAQMIDKP